MSAGGAGGASPSPRPVPPPAPACGAPTRDRGTARAAGGAPAIAAPSYDGPELPPGRHALAAVAAAELRRHPWASQPHVLLAEQKDAAVVRQLERQVSELLDATALARYVSTLGPEIRLAARLLYFLPTVVLPRPVVATGTRIGSRAHVHAVTLGEEYCDLRAVVAATTALHPQRGRGDNTSGGGTGPGRLVALPQPLTRTRAALSVAARAGAEYAAERGGVGWASLARVAQFRSPRLVAAVVALRRLGAAAERVVTSAERRVRAAARLLGFGARARAGTGGAHGGWTGGDEEEEEEEEQASVLIPMLQALARRLATAQRLHLCLFFLSGAYYSFAKRLFRVRHMHLYAQGPPGDVPTYRVLGLITAAEFGLSLLLWLRSVLPALRWGNAAAAGGDDGGEEDAAVAVVPCLPVDADVDSSRWQCGICMCDCTNACACPCGHLYCWECIVQWAGYNKPSCPLCRQPFELRQLIRVRG